jgi:biofilm PGA synthesis N-glycosyltransferase PgaC
VITPVRDDEKYIDATIECVLRQTVLPEEWTIVNDGSTDQTGAVLDRYAAQYPWIRVEVTGVRGTTGDLINFRPKSRREV